MTRYSKFSNKFLTERKSFGSVGETGVCSADKTNMAEIVKRFMHNEPIPNSQLEQNFQYGDNTISYGENDDNINYESLNLVPMTDNLDDVELPEYDEIGEKQISALDRARSIIRGKQKELAEKKDKATREEYERLKNTFEKSELNTKTEVVKPTPTSESN